MISVIVPVYNVEKYLRECLDSLLKQTYKDIEVVMVDDGSIDGSGRICDEYAERYDNFRVIHKKNAGLGMARNTGLEYINGKYVTFLDSDDYIDAEFLELLYNRMKENSVDFCKGGFRRVNDKKEILKSTDYTEEIFEGKKAAKDLLPRMIGARPDKKDSIEMCVCGCLYMTSHIKQNKLCFPSERVLISEDLVFNIDYLQYSNGACVISEVGYNYRCNIDSLTMQYRKDRFEACRYFFLEMKKKCEFLGYDQMTMWRLDRMFFIYLRMCFNQLKQCQLSGRECKKEIQKICDDATVRDTVKYYPVNQLGISQRFFLALIHNKNINLIFALIKCGVI